MYKYFFKRFTDVFVALSALFVFSPVFILVTIGLFFVNNGRPFFFQRRPGKAERIFGIIKFKTMNDKRGVGGELLPDEERLTSVGSFVRKTSLDEIPQLINVIKGDMSLVGPRPLLLEYLPLYNKEQIKRHNVRPGITGWAQINGRNAISWEEKFKLDIYYVEHQSLMMDFRVIFKTVKKVFVSEGISSATSQTMEKFTGS